ncbi:CAP domain-containing protein [Roseateles oligotrophus]|uniref:CAP domain-containing protein n=1 Tax=Roseateles oligotrophus TaxID=1769250 RepID=A0ABT2YKF6_9BURK|nr:CAP domain-containing protein [Roseateles oligotrophus]MCV2370545.1 CAP domain-containing protein [Roseateles oligotrophus]
MLLNSPFILLLLPLWLAPMLAQAAEHGCQDQVAVEQVLNYLNAFRAQPQTCGQQSFVAAGPLRWEARLEQAAQGHAAELAQGDQLNHLALNGRTLRERLRGNGYLAFRVGENLAAGQESLVEVLQTWSSSAKHCDNIMQAEFQDVALACASGPGKYGRYWVMNLGRSVRD